MNYHLTRVRLCSVGPEPARFDPLDLRFLRHDHTGPAHSVLYLPNTGGKTVLLRLLFSVLHPPIVEKIGSEETSERRNKNLPGYVLERDTSHIVMEWRLATAGQFVDEEVLVTGLVAEWPGRKPSANAKDLDREWYSIRGSAAEVGIDRLVFDVSDETGARRRVPMQAFVESVEELGRGGGRNRPVVTTTRVQRTWMEHLDALGLDRALFRYQGKMNHNEAGASAIAQFKNDLDFIEFFLEAVMDPAELDTLDNELDEVANKVRRYPEYERRLRFEEAAVQELEPLAALVATYSDARATVERARQDGMGRVAAFHARAMIARELEGTERSRNAEKREEAVKLSRSADRARDEDRELRRIGTNFWVEEATKAHDDATVRVAAADLDIKSWAVAEEIARLRKAAAEVDALDLAYRDEIDRLKPIQDERDAAARELAARLAADAVLSLIEAKQKDDATIEFRKQAKLAHKDHADALAEASRLENDRAHAEKRLQQVIDQRTKAIEAGLLDSDERADHARERDRLHASKLIEQIANNDEQVKRHQGERTLLDSADENAAPLEGTVRSEIRATKESIDRATRQRDRLIADPLVVEVAESSNIDLDLVGSAIADRLVRRAAEADKSRLELELRAVEHKRAVDSLAETGLLPPSVDVEVVARRLNEAGLRGAIPGTRYIADAIASDRWEHVASLRADLVGGIVLTNRDDLPKAQSILETAALAPSTVIAVGTASSLTALENSEPGDTFIVPPSPALWDKSAAAAERAIRAQKLSAYDSDRAALEERATGARRLAHDMTRYAEEFPPGWLAARKAEHATLAGELGRLENERQSRANRKREIAASTKRLLDETVTLHSALDETNRRIAALVKLADAEAETAEFPARIERLRVETEEWRVAAGAALKKAEIAIEEAQQASNAANDYRTAADRTRLEVSEIHLSETLSYPSAGESAALKAQTPDPSALRARFHAHHQRLVGTTSESRVAAQREEAIKQRNLLKNSIDANQLDVRTRAEILLAASDAADMAGRRRAAQRAETERTLAAGLQKEAYADLDKAKDTLRVIEEDIKRSKRQIQIPPEKTPRDRHQANLQAAEARQRADNLQVQHAIAETDRDAAARRAEEAKTLAEGLERLCKTLSITLQLTEDFVAPAAPAYEGTLDDAINAADKTAASVTKALKDHQGAEARWHAQDDAVRKLLTRDEFADLSATDRLHRRLTQSTMEVLARDVGSLVADLRTSITVLRADLSTQEQDIKLVTTSLAKTVNKALSSLHQAQTRSKMPTALRDWAEQPFLTINFDKPPADDLETRLRTFVVDLLKEPGDRSTGTKLILKALERAVGDFSIKILKPNEGFQLLRVPVSELSTQKFSNGQRSTVATALMLMLSELRRQSRSTSAKGASVGTLLLDNPFGNANAGFLIEVQQKVADAAGIQLVYTTGIADMNALRHFPRVIGLSNDAARRSMRRYVREDSDFVKLLVPPDPPPGGRVTAAYVVAKQEQDEDSTA